MPGWAASGTKNPRFSPFRNTLSDTSPFHSPLPSRLVSPPCRAYPAGSGRASMRCSNTALFCCSSSTSTRSGWSCSLRPLFTPKPELPKAPPRLRILCLNSFLKEDGPCAHSLHSILPLLTVFTAASRAPTAAKVAAPKAASHQRRWRRRRRWAGTVRKSFSARSGQEYPRLRRPDCGQRHGGRHRLL